MAPSGWNPLVRLLATAIGLSAAVAPAVSSEPDLVIVQIADLHSAYDRYARLLSAVDEVREQYVGSAVQIIIGGDLFEGGDPVAVRTAGFLDWKLVEALVSRAPVILAVGNHETDLATLPQVVSRARALGVDVISNLEDRAGRRFVSPVTHLLVGEDGDYHNVTLVAIGPDNPEMYASSARDVLTMPEPVAWARANLDAFVGKSELAIVSSHAGVAADREIMELLPPRSLLLGGHSHLTLVDRMGERTYLQSGAFVEGFAVLEIRFTGSRATVDVRLVRFGNDSVSARVDADFAAEVDRVMLAELTADDLLLVGVSQEARDLRAAAVWAADMVTQATNADVAFLNHTSFGSGLPSGPVDRYRFRRFLRFDNALATATVDLETLTRILDWSRQTGSGRLSETRGDFVYASSLIPTAVGGEIRIITTDWIAANAPRYLGVADLEFSPVTGARTRAILERALAGGASEPAWSTR